MLYLAILKHNSVFSDYTTNPENFQEIVIKFFISNKQNIDFYMIPCLNKFDIYFLRFKEYTLASISKQNEKQEVVLEYLQNLKDEFIRLLNNEKSSLALKSANLLKQIYDSFNTKGSFFNNIDLVENELHQITKEKHKLLNDIIDRELMIDQEIGKSNDLKELSYETSFKAKKAYNTIKSKKFLYFKIFLIFLSIILVILYFKIL